MNLAQGSSLYVNISNIIFPNIPLSVAWEKWWDFKLFTTHQANGILFCDDEVILLTWQIFHQTKVTNLNLTINRFG